MREQPDARQLIEAVAGFLRQVALPRLEGHAAFHARVAANALDIVRRELGLGAAAARRELEGLRALLKTEEGDAEQLNDALCDAIAERTFSAQDPALIRHLWTTTLDALAVDQPNYETFRRACELPEARQDRSRGET
jgi:hypothetical protein